MFMHGYEEILACNADANASYLDATFFNIDYANADLCIRIRPLFCT